MVGQNLWLGLVAGARVCCWGRHVYTASILGCPLGLSLAEGPWKGGQWPLASNTFSGEGI